MNMKMESLDVGSYEINETTIATLRVELDKHSQQEEIVERTNSKLKMFRNTCLRIQNDNDFSSEHVNFKNYQKDLGEILSNLIDQFLVSISKSMFPYSSNSNRAISDDGFHFKDKAKGHLHLGQVEAGVNMVNSHGKTYRHCLTVMVVALVKLHSAPSSNIVNQVKEDLINRFYEQIKKIAESPGDISTGKFKVPPKNPREYFIAESAVEIANIMVGAEECKELLTVGTKLIEYGLNIPNRNEFLRFIKRLPTSFERLVAVWNSLLILPQIDLDLNPLSILVKEKIVASINDDLLAVPTRLWTELYKDKLSSLADVLSKSGLSDEECELLGIFNAYDLLADILKKPYNGVEERNSIGKSADSLIAQTSLILESLEGINFEQVDVEKLRPLIEEQFSSSQDSVKIKEFLST